MYCLVEFVGPNPSIAIAHKNWLSGSKCYWPPFWKDSNRLKNALLKGISANTDTWQLFEVHIIGNRFFGTYDEARRKQMLPDDRLDVSDLSSAEELQRLRKRTRNVPMNMGSDSSCDEDTSLSKTAASGKTKKKSRNNPKIGIRAPTPPSQVVLGPTTPTPTLIAVEQLHGATAGGAGINAADPGGATRMSFSFSNEELFGCQPIVADNLGHTVGQEVVTSPLFRDPPSTPSPASYVRSTHPQPSTSTSAQFVPAAFSIQSPSSSNGNGVLDSNDNTSAIKALQVQMTILTAKTDLCVEMLRTILQGQNKHVKESGRFQLPMTNEETVTNILEQLKNTPDARRDLATILSTTGGDNINQIAHRVMSILMTDELMNSYSFAGKKGKRSFRDSAFFPVVCEAVRMQPKGSIGSDKEIGKAVEYWLKKSSSRLSKKT